MRVIPNTVHYPLSIVIPAHNEAAAIARVVAGAREHGHVIVVDDASTDDTAHIAAAAGADIVRLDTNRGYDGALEAGIARAQSLGCKRFVTMDADGQHDAALIAQFDEALNAGADVVVGHRDRFQRAGERVFALAGSLLWGIDDPLCGLKGYHMSVYDGLGHFDSYQSIGTELAIYAARRGYNVVNLRIAVRPRDGASRFGVGWRANARLLRALALGAMRTARR